MLMLDAYFDETGHSADPNTRILGIAGCLTEAKLWKKVESKWKEALKSEGLPYFHMREYSFSVGEFKGWKGDEARRKKIYDALWKIILEAELIPLGAFVQLDNYKLELTGQEHLILGDAYFLCYLQCLKFLAQYADFDLISNVATFFDNKPGFRGEAFRIHGALSHHFMGKIPPPVFRDMRVFLPLQIADIIAYESKKEFERQLFTPEHKPRPGFRNLAQLMSGPTHFESVPFGSEGCPIALLSKEELAEVSTVQKLMHEE